MRKLLLALSFAVTALTATSAQASHLSCNNSSNLPNTTLLGFNFDVQVPSNAGSGSGGGAGRSSSSSVVVELPVDATYVRLAESVFTGRHSESCVLIDYPAGAHPIEITLSDVVFSQIQLLNGPDFTSGKAAQAVVQLTLTASRVEVRQD